MAASGGMPVAKGIGPTADVSVSETQFAFQPKLFLQRLMNAGTTLPFNWFDLIVAAVLVLGVFRGRKHGMSEELLPLLQWLIAVVGGALVYKPLGKLLAQSMPVSLLLAYIISYLIIIIALQIVFSWMKRMVGEKLFASDLFGGLEYYLGMLAGAIRFACILLTVLAVLNARYVSPEELAADAKMQQESFGDISFPTLGRIQGEVFKKSFSGKFVHKYLDQQLIAATSPGAKVSQGENIGQRKTRVLDEVMGK